MAHPFKSGSHHSSRAKMRSISDQSGGGGAYRGSSHFTRMKANGSIKNEYPSRRKSGGRVEGEESKPRLDKRARGGGVGGGKHHGKKGHTTNIAIVMPRHNEPAAPHPGGGMPPAPPPAAAPPPMPPMGGAGGLGGLGGAGGAGQALGALTGGTGSNPLAGLGRGFKEGGSVGSDIGHWSGYAAKGRAHRRAAGGRMTAGAESGKGRLQKAEIAKKK